MKIISYECLIRWLRETHVTPINEEFLLHEFRHNNTQIKIYFDRLSLTGFHKINRVVSIDLLQKEILIAEDELNLLLKKEASYRVKDAQISVSDEDVSTVSVNEENYKNGFFVEEKIIDGYLRYISDQADNIQEEEELFNVVIKKIQLENVVLAKILLFDYFLPGISVFFPSLDGIGIRHPAFGMDNMKKGRIWLKNPFIRHVEKKQIPSLNFIFPFHLMPDWTMRDATLDDVYMIHKWMNEPILAETFRQNYSLLRWEKDLKELIDSPYTKPMILSYKTIDSAYTELYRPLGVSVSESFLCAPNDIGFHLGIVNENLISKKIGRQLVEKMSNYFLQLPNNIISQVFLEPDVNNIASCKAVLKSGFFYHAASIAMPHKCSHIMKSF